MNGGQQLAALKKELNREIEDHEKTVLCLLALWRASHAAYCMDQDPKAWKPDAADWRDANGNAARLLQRHLGNTALK